MTSSFAAIAFRSSGSGSVAVSPSKMLTGVYQPDSGDIIMDGEKKRFHSVRESMEAGIGMVYQERNLIPMLNGAQNICLGAVAGGSTGLTYTPAS